MRSNPQSPLATHEPNPEKIIRKGKDLQGASSSKFSGIYGDLPEFVFHTPVVVSHVSHLPITETHVKLELEYFLVEYTTLSPDLKQENLKSFDFLASPKIVKWFRLESLEDFNFLGSPTPHSFKFLVTKEERTSVSIEIPLDLPKSHLAAVKSKSSPPYTPFSKPPIIQITVSPVNSPSTSPKSQSPPFPNQMVGINPLQNKMDAIVDARYAPLVFSHPMNALPVG
jgi:hypothetical protein